jgi:hypothetical protein
VISAMARGRDAFSRLIMCNKDAGANDALIFLCCEEAFVISEEKITTTFLLREASDLSHTRPSLAFFS